MRVQGGPFLLQDPRGFFLDELLTDQWQQQDKIVSFLHKIVHCEAGHYQVVENVLRQGKVSPKPHSGRSFASFDVRVSIAKVVDWVNSSELSEKESVKQKRINHLQSIYPSICYSTDPQWYWSRASRLEPRITFVSTSWWGLPSVNRYHLAASTANTAALTSPPVQSTKIQKLLRAQRTQCCTWTIQYIQAGTAQPYMRKH